LDVEWEAAMSALTEHIMVIDDLADRVHDCDVLLDQNLHRAGMENRYEKLTPPNCKKLLGPKYALLRPEFKEIRSNLKVRDGSVKRIFVFFGGSDPTNETMKALIAIQQLDRADIAIDVVVGSTNPHREDIAGLCAAQPGAKLHRQINNIAELMASADMAIGAGGGAMWERCCLGLPSIVMSAAKNQDPGCEATAGIGAILYLGKAESVGEELIEGTLRVALSAPDLLMSMSEKSIALVDGQGGMRVVRKLVAPVIALRRAELDDCESIFDWRNDKETRRYSSENRPIPLNEHVTWFKSALENQNRAILIGEINSSAVGVLRFDRKERSAVISVFLVPGNHGKGIGGKMIEQGTLWLESNWPEVTSIEAVIMDGNSASISAFSEAGFKKKAYTYVKQIRK
jgi:UDP-2,4-diacetamido-2,4,6-trideoxy-beta-L-altropyranose hydrolase